MADRPATLTQPLTRAQINEWLGGNPRIVRWFEAAIRDISAILPDATYSAATAAESAQVTADAARIVADEAVALAEESAQGADTAHALAQAGLAEIARLWTALAGAGGGSVVSGTVTVTVPQNSYFHSENVALLGCAASMRLFCSIAPHDDSDENSEEMLSVEALAAIAGTDAATVRIAFSEPTTGPVKINLMAV